MSFASATLLLLLLMDPAGNLPVFVAVLEKLDPARRRRVVVRELVAAYGVLLAFLLAGNWLMGLLRVQPEALSMAGGIILFLASIRMIFPSSGGELYAADDQEPFFVPLAVPLVAGPASMTMLLILATRHAGQLPLWIAALTVAWAAAAAFLMLHGPLQRLLGPRGVRAMARLMGMILVLLAVQMLLDGLAAFLTSIRPTVPVSPPQPPL